MTRSHSIFWRILPGLVLFAMLAASGRCEPLRPNILFILADDMGYGDVEALNPESRIPTPNLNKLAGRGLVFSDAHTSSSVCTPTRYGLLTGRYNWRSRLKNGVAWGASRRLIEPDRLTLAAMLQSSGYHTSAIGKWHLGMDWPLIGGGIADDDMQWNGKSRITWAIDYAKPVTNGPISLGFDHFFGISASLDMPPYVWIHNDRPQVTTLRQKAFHRNGPADEDFEAVDVLPRITYEVVRKINAWSTPPREGHPFFIYVPLAAPHTPISPTSDWSGRSGLNSYGDFVMQVDAAVGEMVQALDSRGLTDNTLVIFSSDNGCSPAANLEEMEIKGHFANAPWRGHKADIFEGGHRVPFIAQWPAVIRPASRTNHLICLTDVFATLADILGFELPPNAAEDSVSFLSAFREPELSKPPADRAIVHHSIQGAFALRLGDWKLCLCPGSGGWSAPRPGSPAEKNLPAVQLYNLKTDPSESNNLAPENPAKVRELYALLSQYVENGRSNPGPKSSNTTPVNIHAGLNHPDWRP